MRVAFTAARFSKNVISKIRIRSINIVVWFSLFRTERILGSRFLLCCVAEAGQAQTALRETSKNDIVRGLHEVQSTRTKFGLAICLQTQHEGEQNQQSTFNAGRYLNGSSVTRPTLTTKHSDRDPNKKSSEYLLTNLACVSLKTPA